MTRAEQDADDTQGTPPAPMMPLPRRAQQPEPLPSPVDLAATLGDVSGDTAYVVGVAYGAAAARLDALLRLPPGAVLAGVVALRDALRGQR